MESVENPAVEALQGRLNHLNIAEDDGEGKTVTKTNGSTTGWKSKESIEDMREKFQNLTRRAKEMAQDGDLEESLKLYQKAYKLHKSEKVEKRIKKLEAMLEEFDDENSDDDNQNGYIKISKGFKMSEKIYNHLYPYQKEGVMWFWKLYEARKGGILGDDMGLGKTIQVISFLAGMFGSGHIKTVLIFMPVSLLTNWEKEFRKWAPEVRVRNFHGSSVRQRSDNLAKIQSRNGVCLTTYGLANTCCKQFSEDRYGDSFKWDYIILDEGHKIKNTANKTTIAIRSIPATNHFILTGTPIQNNLREMWALFDFVCEGQLLGTSRSFKQEYENPIVRARERDATAYEKRMGQEMSAHLRELIAPHFLRRTKDILEQFKKKTGTSDDVAQDDVDGSSDKENQETNGTKKPKLTRKNDFIIWLFLSPTQLQIYQDFIKLDRVKEILMTTKSPLAELNVLKKVCDHPRLLSTMACKQLGLNEDIDDEEDTDANYQWCAPPVEQLVQESGKLVFLVQLLQQLKTEGHRTLVFSQSRKMLDIIQKVLNDKDIKSIRIDGTITNIIERESRINTFQTDSSYSVFLLTTQVGGVGLTLTAADRVVIFDPSWNPATDAQAVDRAYRIGQKNTVVIYRLITCGSLEEKIYRKQVFKQAITKQTTGSSKNPFRYFTRHELRDLFVLDNHRSSKTQIQLEQMHSQNRVTDTLLDEHVAFLYSTDIFGISDHDLLFTKEAVATEEELSAASEMSDVIQAKVRRAADIMRTESSQAIGRVNAMPSPLIYKKKSQSKIEDHAVEVFIPSKEDSRRFKPAKKVSKSPPPSDIIDLTVLDVRTDDDDALEQQFSAIALNDNRANNPVEVEQSVVRNEVSDKVVEITPEVYFQEPKQNEKELVRVKREEGSKPLINHPRLSSPNVATSFKKTQGENVDSVEIMEAAEFSGNNSGEEISRKRNIGRIIHNDENSDDGQSSEFSGNSKTSRHVLKSDSEGESEVDRGSERERQDIRENTSIFEKSAGGSEGKEVSNTSLEIDQQSESLEIVREETQAGNVHTVEEEIMETDPGNVQQSDSETDEEISRKRPSRRVIESDESSEDEDEISKNNRKNESSRHVIESDSENEIEVHGKSVEIQENIPNHEKGKIMENRVEDTKTRSSPEILAVNSDSENEDVFSNHGSLDSEKSDSGSEIERYSMNAKVSSENLSESENEVFVTPRSSTSSWNAPEKHSVSEKQRVSSGHPMTKILENDSGTHGTHHSPTANEASSEENKSLNKESRNDSENEEDAAEIHGGDRNDSSDNCKESPKKSNSTMESNSESEHSSTEDENTDHSQESSENETPSDEKKSADNMSQNDSENKEDGAEIHDEDHDDTSENSKESSPRSNSTTESNSESEQNSTKDENTDNSEESSDVQPSYTTCCPRGIHVSDSFNIRKCPCVMSSDEKEAYKMHVNTARRYEKSGEPRRALKHFAEAFKLCDNDARLRAKIHNCYKLVKKSSSDAS